VLIDDPPLFSGNLPNVVVYNLPSSF